VKELSHKSALETTPSASERQLLDKLMTRWQRMPSVGSTAVFSINNERSTCQHNYHNHAAIITTKRDYNSKLISSNLSDSRKLWYTVNSLLHRKSVPVFSSSVCLNSLFQSFATSSPINFTNFTLAFFLKAITARLM
jgi:hypothetical protein